MDNTDFTASEYVSTPGAEVQPPPQLDLSTGHVVRGGVTTALRQKTLAVLRYLMDRPGEVISISEFQATVWSDAIVTPGVLRNCILELRTALGDLTHTPRYVATISRRGYRLIAPIPIRNYAAPQPADGSAEASRQHGGGPAPPPRLTPPLPTPFLEGRDSELGLLHNYLAKALRGERQMVFVTGEPGIGKTALVRTFLEHVERQGLRVAQGQCIEHYGIGEAYLPVLEAFSDLARQPGSYTLMPVLRQYAPMWLAELPGSLAPDDRQQLQRDLQGVSRERMLRELNEALEVLSADVPLVLLLEDLHWADDATLTQLSSIKRHRRPARLLVIGTYRPVEAMVRQRPLNSLVSELRMHDQCEELQITPLSESAVGDYLSKRFSGITVPAVIAQALRQRAEGIPFFLVKLINEVVAQEMLVRGDEGWRVQAATEYLMTVIPDSIRQLIEKQLDLLRPDERRVLEAASVAGMTFSAAAVVTALELDIPYVEALCEQLCRRYQFLSLIVSASPELELRQSSRYRFVHTLYREVVHTQLTAGQRTRLHQRIGAWKETVLSLRAQEHAAELALHFELGHDYQRALHYRRLAAQTAIRHAVAPDALSHLSRALSLLRSLPDTPDRAAQDEAELMRLKEEVLLLSCKRLSGNRFGSSYDKEEGPELKGHKRVLRMAEEHEKRKAYPSDLTDAQWTILAPLIPAPRNTGGGRPRELDMREVLNTLLYLNRSGCQWEMLPHDLLPKSSVYDYFAQWREDGTWTKILTVLRERVRRDVGGSPPRVRRVSIANQ